MGRFTWLVEPALSLFSAVCTALHYRYAQKSPDVQERRAENLQPAANQPTSGFRNVHRFTAA